MPKLRLSSDLSLPLELVTESVGILAVKRAGKSHTAKKLTEQLHRAGPRLPVTFGTLPSTIDHGRPNPFEGKAAATP